MSKELQEYISNARSQGKSDESIVQELLKAGWKNELVQSVLNDNEKNGKKPKSKKIFSHILLLVILSVITFILNGVCALGGCPSILWYINWGFIGGLIFLVVYIVYQVIQKFR